MMQCVNSILTTGQSHLSVYQKLGDEWVNMTQSVHNFVVHVLEKETAD